MRAIVWSVTAGSPSAEILFPKGDEDPDHLVASIELPRAPIDEQDGWRLARRVLDEASLEQLAAWKLAAHPIDRGAIA